MLYNHQVDKHHRQEWYFVRSLLGVSYVYVVCLVLVANTYKHLCLEFVGNGDNGLLGGSWEIT